MAKSPITTHVLDTSKGKPAVGLRVVLEFQNQANPGSWMRIGNGVTDDDGRVSQLLGSDHRLSPGFYRLTFFVADYQVGFYPEIPIIFEVNDINQHYHVPLLLNPFGYSTYRGS